MTLLEKCLITPPDPDKVPWGRCGTGVLHKPGSDVNREAVQAKHNDLNHVWSLLRKSFSTNTRLRKFEVSLIFPFSMIQAEWGESRTTKNLNAPAEHAW